MPAKGNKTKKTKSTFRGLTDSDKASSYGLSVSDYKKRVKINNERMAAARSYISKNAKGVSDTTKRKNVMKDAWKNATADVKKKYSAAELSKLKLTF